MEKLLIVVLTVGAVFVSAWGYSSAVRGETEQTEHLPPIETLWVIRAHLDKESFTFQRGGKTLAFENEAICKKFMEFGEFAESAAVLAAMAIQRNLQPDQVSVRCEPLVPQTPI